MFSGEWSVLSPLDGRIDVCGGGDLRRDLGARRVMNHVYHWHNKNDLNGLRVVTGSGPIGGAPWRESE